MVSESTLDQDDHLKEVEAVKRTLLLVLFAILLAAPSTLFAQEADAHKGEAGATLTLAFDTLGEAPAESSVTHFSVLLDAMYKVMPQVIVSVDFGFTNTSVAPDQGDSQSDFSISNPVIGGHYIFMDNAGMLAHAGLEIAIPVVSVPDGTTVQDQIDAAAREINLGYASGARGRFGEYMWIPDFLSIIVPVGAEMHFASGLNAGGELSFVYGIYTGETLEVAGIDLTPENEADLELALDVSFEAGMVEPGLRYTLVARLTAEDTENAAQMAIEPFVKAKFGPGFGRLGFLMSLDKPLGFAFGSEPDKGIWAINIGGGANF